MPDNTDFDPSRLTHLARIRDQRRAVVRSLADRYADLREKRVDVDRRLRLAREELTNTHGRFGFEAQEKVKDLQGQYDALTSNMREVQAEQDALASEATEAGQVYKAALAFAVDKGLSIPASLAADAAAVDPARMPAHPGGAS